MDSIGGIIGFFIALLLSFIICRKILKNHVNNSTSGNIEYDKLVMRSILPINPDISIDLVVSELDKMQMHNTQFGLAENIKKENTYEKKSY